MNTGEWLKEKAAGVRWRRLAVAAGVAWGLLLAVVSCESVNRSVVQLPEYPGAKYIGSKECEQCHEELCRDFQTADHARLVAEGPNALGAGCESCHGPGSAHADSGGEVKPPYSFAAQRPRQASFAGNTMIPPGRGTVDAMCFQCHGDVRGQFNLPSHHPVPEGRLSCTQCHSPHKGSIRAGGNGALRAADASCLSCHPAQRGPYVFEHEAMREGCTACHTAHGSVNAKLLTARDSNLCLKCHFQQVVPGGGVVIGGVDHSVRLSIGTCWTAGCHEAVHGSRVNSSLRF
ncbi:MAG: cytochrome c3 family protein [Verrucomicrobiota bacterium]